MNMSTAFVLTIVIALGTYLLRAVPALLLADRELPVPVQRALRNVGPAVLAALVVVSVASTADGGIEVEVAEVAALVAAGVVAWWRRNLIWSLLAGMAALWVTLVLV
ncbi:MAG: AzlD domain-containing protein [Ilumatobacter sp.]|nr:MAG: AzlD domain-containing protein [Ilumatobacter sp.]